MARQCFAQNGVFVDHCPIFYMIVVGSFQLQAFWFYPWCPTDRAEQFICWPLLFFGCTFLWIWEKGRGLFLACPSDCFVLILLLSARQKREKPQTPLTPQEKPQTLTVEKYVFMTYSLPKYSSGTVRWVLCFLVLSMVSDLHVSCVLIQASVLSADQFWVCEGNTQVFESCFCFQSLKSAKI